MTGYFQALSASLHHLASRCSHCRTSRSPWPAGSEANGSKPAGFNECLSCSRTALSQLPSALVIPNDGLCGCCVCFVELKPRLSWEPKSPDLCPCSCTRDRTFSEKAQHFFLGQGAAAVDPARKRARRDTTTKSRSRPKTSNAVSLSAPAFSQLVARYSHLYPPARVAAAFHPANRARSALPSIPSPAATQANIHPPFLTIPDETFCCRTHTRRPQHRHRRHSSRIAATHLCPPCRTIPGARASRSRG
jgi:hypothetical protein